MRRRTILKLCAAGGGLMVAATQPAGAAVTEDGPASNRLPSPAKGRIPVAFAISADAEVVDFAGPWGVFEYVHVAGTEGSPFELYTVAESKALIKVSGGMTVVPDYTFANAPQPKLIVVPAMGEPPEAMISWIRQASKSADLTASICTGAFVLAKAGLLAGKTVATHHGALGMLAAMYPDITVKGGARFVDDGNISTSGGLTSGIDLTLHIVERYYGREVAAKTATSLEYQGQGWKDPNSNTEFAKKPVSTDAHPLCPVCDMDVDKATALNSVYKGRTYYFCYPGCKKLFASAPDKFAEQ